MIVTQGPLTWLQFLVRARGTALERITQRLFFVFCFSGALTALKLKYGIGLSFTTVPFSLVSVALGIFLGFRNNASYDRFWEGRKLWGLLINTTRSFTRQVTLLVGLKGQQEAELKALQEDVVLRTVGYVHAFRHHLRGGVRLDELTEYFSAEERERLARVPNAPIVMLADIGGKLAEAYRNGWVDSYHLALMEQTLSKFADIQGGCERIKNTPVPFSYSVVIHRLVGVYVLALPFALVEHAGIFTPAVTLLIAYAFLGIDAVGDELEDPFGTDPNDLPLTALSNTIERDLKAVLGLPLPAKAVPQNEVLT